MAGIYRSFFGFPFLKNLTEVELCEDVSSDCVCSLCGIVCSEFYALPCDHRLCVLCYLDVERKGLKCPLDGRTFEHREARTVNNRCEDLSTRQAFCFNRTRGCAYQGGLSSIQGHYSFCGFSNVRCETCHLRLLRRDLLDHLTNENDHPFDANFISDDHPQPSEVRLRRDRSSLRDSTAGESDEEQPNAITAQEFEQRIRDLQQQLEDRMQIKNRRLFKNITLVIASVSLVLLLVFVGSKSDLKEEDIHRAVRNVDSRVESCVFQWDVDFSEEQKAKTAAGKFKASSKKFYSFTRGYHFSLFAKNSPQHPKHLGVYFSINPGPYDTELKWPFLNKVTFKVVNFKNPSRTINVTLDDLRECQCCINPYNVTTGFGRSQLIPLSELESESSGYMQENKFRVEFVIHPADTVLSIN